MRRWKLAAALALVALGAVYWQHLLGLVMFGYWPQSHVERLDSPVSVLGWQHDGLHLADGRTFQLPGFTRLPETSEALRRAAERGVEITPEGRAIGIMKVWHWCGNDPLWWDYRRIDLAHLLEFMREGEFERGITDDDWGPNVARGGFNGKHGWIINEYGAYRMFVQGKKKFVGPSGDTI